MDNIESLAKKIFAECEKDGEPVSFEDALEMAKMELKAGGINRGTETKPREKKPKVRKVDETKKQILTDIKDLLEGVGAIDTALKNEVELSFTLDNSNYSIRLIKHRKEKN